MAGAVTVFFGLNAVQQYPACYLAASVRCYLPDSTVLIAYHTAQGLRDVSAEALETLRRLRCELREVDVADAGGEAALLRAAVLAPRGEGMALALSPASLFVKPWEVTQIALHSGDVLTAGGADPAALVMFAEGSALTRHWPPSASLSEAIAAASLEARTAPSAFHATLPLPSASAAEGAACLSYQTWDDVKQAGHAAAGLSALRRLTGTERVGRIFEQAPPPGIAQAAPARATPDPSKADMAAVTMVHQDYFFLDRWIRYYEAQIGRENLYILCHGEDPRIERLARGANCVYLPNPDDKAGFDRRRWVALSKFTSGLTLYYNWVLCNDVDEIVAVDPEISESLPAYLNSKFTQGRVPSVLAPFGLELVHVPGVEPDLITPQTPILSVRKAFRPNAACAKPCLTRRRIEFSDNGRGCNLQRVALDPHLYLFRLRYVQSGFPRSASSEISSGADLATLDTCPPEGESFDFEAFRQQMINSQHQDATTGNWMYGDVCGTALHTLPERFATVF